MRSRLLVLVGIGLCSIAAPLRAQVVNGGFETGFLAPAWTLSGNCANSVGIDNFVPHSGSLAMYAGPIGPTCDVTQTVATTIGQQYTFAYFLQNEGPGVNLFEARFGGVTYESLDNVDAFLYAQRSFVVTAAAASTNISFRFRNDDYYWDMDDVSLTAITTAPPTTAPEPSTVALFGAGLLGVGMFRLRRRV